MSIINDITDRLARPAVAYGRHPVKGTTTKHVVDANGPSVWLQQCLGQAAIWNGVTQKFECGGWDSIEHLYYQGFEIDSSGYHFHSGGAADAPDAYFPADIAHPRASYYSSQLPAAIAAQIAKDGSTPDQMVGIFKALKVANYNSDGAQIDNLGALLPGGANPDDYLYWSASPARGILDLMRRARRSLVHVNYPAWVAWRDYCATLIDWDDGALTPHQISLALHAGGSLTSGTRYWIRVATLKGADISSASKDRASDGVTTASIVVSGGNLSFDVTWTSQVSRGATAYRVYIGTAEGAEDRYFTVSDPNINTLTISTLTGATLGTPPAIATGTLLRHIPRFESHVFFPQPFDLSVAMDRIAQITCMDWQYANGKLVFLTPEVRSPVFTLNLAEATNFKTYQTDRRNKPNQIIVNYRDLDDPYLSQADPPVEVDRYDLQAKEGVRPFEINGGCMYRSQAERVGNYWARRLIDSDQMLEVLGSPRTYIVLPGDPINVTHDVPNWTNLQFYIEEKEEQEDSKAGYQMTGRIYGAWYSDTSHEPLPRPLPTTNPSAFAAPPLVTSVTLSQKDTITAAGLVTGLAGAVQFAPFVGRQRGRVWWQRPGAGGYEATHIILIPDPVTLQAAFEIPGVAAGLHRIKVVTESELGASQNISLATAYSFTITAPAGALPSTFVANFSNNGDELMEWVGTPFPAAPTLEVYDLEIRNSADTATILGPITVTPALSRQLSETPPLARHAFTPDVGAPASIIHYTDPGGVYIQYDGGHLHSSYPLTAIETPAASPVGGLYAAYKIPLDTAQFSNWVPGYFHLIPTTSITWLDGFGWARSVSGSTLFLVARDPAGNVSSTYTMTPGDTLGVLVRPDMIVEFYVNRIGDGSNPFWIAPTPVDITKLYKLAIVEDGASYEGGVGSFLKVGIADARWVRQGPEWMFAAGAQRAVNSGSLPATIKARVRQHSFYAGGDPSAWVNGIFTRP